MARQNDAGLHLRKGKRKSTWRLTFSYRGERHQVRLASNVSRTVAIELASAARVRVMRGEWGLGAPPKKKDISFEAAAALFIEHARTNLRPGSVRIYQGAFARLAQSFGSMMLSQITTFGVEAYKRARAAEGVRASLNMELAALGILFNRMIEWEKFQGVNPARRVKKMETPKGRMRFLSADEERRLLDASPEPYRLIFMTAIYTGLRVRAEILTLQWENVDFRRREITVLAPYSKNKETQTIPLHSKLIELLLELHKSRKNEWVFTDSHGSRFRHIHKPFSAACRQAHITGCSPHTLRHTFASRLAMAGANDRTIQALGRWKSIQMIQRYSHLSKEQLASALEKIGLQERLREGTASAEVIELKAV
jgi:integrase